MIYKYQKVLEIILQFWEQRLSFLKEKMARYDDIQILSFYGIKTTKNKVKKCQRQLNRKNKERIQIIIKYVKILFNSTTNKINAKYWK